MIIFLLVLGFVAIAMLGLFLGLIAKGRKDKPRTCQGVADEQTSHEDHTCDHCTCGVAERTKPNR